MPPCGTRSGAPRLPSALSSRIDDLHREVDASDRRTIEHHAADREACAVQFAIATKERLSTMHAFEAIDLLELVTVTGGEDNGSGTFGPGAGGNRTRAEGELSVTTPVGVQVTGRGTYEQARTDYGACLDKLPSNPTADQIGACNSLLAGGR